MGVLADDTESYRTTVKLVSESLEDDSRVENCDQSFCVAELLATLLSLDS